MDKAKFLEVRELQTVTVATPDGLVTIRELTLAERIEFERKAAEEGIGSYTACLIVASVIDAGGNRLLDWEDAKTIDGLAATRMKGVIPKARELNKLGDDADDTAAVDTAAKNLPATVPASASSSST